MIKRKTKGKKKKSFGDTSLGEGIGCFLILLGLAILFSSPAIVAGLFKLLSGK